MTPLHADIWILAEASKGCVLPESFEAAAFVRRLAAALGFRPCALILGDPVEGPAHEMAETTGLDVWGLRVPGLRDYNAETYRFVLTSFFRSHAPRFFFLSHSSTGWDLAPALSVDLGASCLSAVLDFKVEERIVFTRPLCNGKVLEDVRPAEDRPAVVTVLPGAHGAEPQKGMKCGRVTVSEFTPPPTRAVTLRVTEAAPRSTNLRDADVILAAGRGMESPEHLPILFELAALFPKAAVGASRPVCDLGWLPMEHQVGMTGQSVSPSLYIACGISGAVQHTMGITRADLIVVINRDPNALFCRSAHACVIADLKEFLPVLLKQIRSRVKPESDR